MSRKSDKTRRFISKFFKERQIYHRSDGVVHFISMSTRTQIALASVIGLALLWVAYASVNVVFKEQIIVAKDRAARVQRDLYERRLQKSVSAYNDMNALNVILQEQSDEAMSEISSRLQMLVSMVERTSAVDAALDTLSKGLSGGGFPDGSKPVNSNRIMIDVAPAEPTPRQSRVSALMREARQEAGLGAISAPPNTIAADAMNRLSEASAELYVQQVMLLASLEERAQAEIDQLSRILEAAGLRATEVRPSRKISNMLLAQGGPFIDASNVGAAGTHFFRHANRTSLQVEELLKVHALVNTMPLGSPLVVGRRQTSGFGVRRDPINGSLASHHGLDFAAPWASPIVATGAGVVTFSGVRQGFGRTVEIDHGNGFTTRYAHLNRFVVQAGQKVKLNQKIGELGNSGRSTGPHVHYEIIFRGAARNPQRFIEAGRYVFES